MALGPSERSWSWVTIRTQQAKYQKDLTDEREPEKRSPTWRVLIPFLRRACVPLEDCFFTNFFIGVAAGSKSKGKFPGANDPDFVERCGKFLAVQLAAQRPRVVLTLGRFVPSELAGIAPKLDGWSNRTLSEIDEDENAVVHDVKFNGVESATCSVVA